MCSYQAPGIAAGPANVSLCLGVCTATQRSANTHRPTPRLSQPCGRRPPMTVRRKPPALALLALAGFVCAVAPPRVSAQTWANNAYRYRAPLTITNPSGAAVAAGDVIAFSYNPGYGIFEGKARADSKD